QAHGACARQSRVSKDVGMATYEFLGHEANRRLEITTSRFLEGQRQENALEEKIADLVEQLRVVATRGRVGDFVRLLDGVRDDRPRGLLPVPRALAPQPLGQLLELDERVRQGQASDVPGSV